MKSKIKAIANTPINNAHIMLWKIMAITFKWRININAENIFKALAAFQFCNLLLMFMAANFALKSCVNCSDN